MCAAASAAASSVISRPIDRCPDADDYWPSKPNDCCEMPPETPSFVKQHKVAWGYLYKYLNIDAPHQKINSLRCRIFSPKLLFAAAVIYDARFAKEEDTALQITIDDKKAEIELVENSGPQYDHCYLLLKAAEEWVIDATWQQFSFGHGMSERDPYNRSLLNDCPDILVCRRNDIKPYFKYLSNLLEMEGHLEQAIDLSKKSTIWERSRPATGETRFLIRLLKELARPMRNKDPDADLTCDEAIHEFLKGWDALVESLQISAAVSDCARRIIAP